LATFTGIDDRLKLHLESGVAVVVGTRDAGSSPEITRGWGARVLPDNSSMEVFVSRSAGAATLRNLQDNGEIAVVFCLPTSYKTVQLKGHIAETGEPTQAHCEWVERHKNAFATEAESVGVPRSLISNLICDDLVRIRFVVQQAFEQTPGPSAGGSL
jgi:hypothetical protein